MSDDLGYDYALRKLEAANARIAAALDLLRFHRDANPYCNCYGCRMGRALEGEGL